MHQPFQNGSYILLINLPEPHWIKVGRLGEIYFNAGWYAYIGSAMRGFGARIPHHLRSDKKLHWHVDYLLQAASIKKIILFNTETRIECLIARDLMKRFDFIPGFGCGDCKCRSHLFYSDIADSFQNDLVVGKVKKVESINETNG